MSEPNESPFASQVHNDQRSTSTTGLDENTRSGMRGKLIESILQIVLQAIKGFFLPGPLGSAFDQLSDFFSNILPEQIRAPIGQLVELLISALNLIPIFGPLAGDAVEYLANVFGLINTQATSAQDSANTANVGVAQIKAQLDAGTTGALISDTFDGPSADNLGANWAQTYTGSGKLGVDGSGKAHWFTSGGSSASCIARYTATTFNTDYQGCSFVLDEHMWDLFVNPELYLMLRVNSSLTHGVAMQLDYNSVTVSYTTTGVSGLVTLASHSISTHDGDLWEFRAGVGTTGDDPYTFQVLQNNNNVFDTPVVDTGHASQLGASYRYTGFVYVPGVQVVFGVPDQKSPTNILVFTANDRSV